MPIADAGWPALIPELVVDDLAASLRCWVDQLGFAVLYRRDDPSFAMLRLGRAQVMLEQRNATSWLTGELVRPYGRGINLEIEHPDPEASARRLDELGIPPWRPLRRSTYVGHGGAHGAAGGAGPGPRRLPPALRSRRHRRHVTRERRPLWRAGVGRLRGSRHRSGGLAPATAVARLRPRSR